MTVPAVDCGSEKEGLAKLELRLNVLPSVTVHAQLVMVALDP